MNMIPVNFRGKIVGYYDPKSEQTSINKDEFDEIVEALGTQHIGISSRAFAKSVDDYDNRTITSFDIIDFNVNKK